MQISLYANPFSALELFFVRACQSRDCETAKRFLSEGQSNSNCFMSLLYFFRNRQLAQIVFRLLRYGFKIWLPVRIAWDSSRLHSLSKHDNHLIWMDDEHKTLRFNYCGSWTVISLIMWSQARVDLSFKFLKIFLGSTAKDSSINRWSTQPIGQVVTWAVEPSLRNCQLCHLPQASKL